MTNKEYDKQVKEWWTNKFSNTKVTLNSFFETLEKEKVQMKYTSYPEIYQIFQVIEGDTFFVNSSYGYCLLYTRHKIFIKLIFPFEIDYVKIF